MTVPPPPSWTTFSPSEIFGNPVRPNLRVPLHRHSSLSSSSKFILSMLDQASDTGSALVAVGGFVAALAAVTTWNTSSNDLVRLHGFPFQV